MAVPQYQPDGRCGTRMPCVRHPRWNHSQYQWFARCLNALRTACLPLIQGRHKKHGACASCFQQMLVRPLRRNFHAGQNVHVKTQPVLARADVIHLELFRAGHCGQHGQHQNKQLLYFLHCVFLKMGMKKPRCVCIVVEVLVGYSGNSPKSFRIEV